MFPFANPTHAKVVGDRPGAAAAAARPYVDNVVREIRATAAGVAAAESSRNATGKIRPNGGSVTDDFDDGAELDGGRGASGGIKTLFFGGGTPSLCPPELVGVLMETVRESYGIAAGAEISIEMDPGTFDEVCLRLCDAPEVAVRIDEAVPLGTLVC